MSPEVSELDFSTAVVVQGFTVPGLRTRKANTQIELEQGQSFAIAGLFRDELTDVNAKLPWLETCPFWDLYSAPPSSRATRQNW